MCPRRIPTTGTSSSWRLAVGAHDVPSGSVSGRHASPARESRSSITFTWPSAQDLGFAFGASVSPGVPFAATAAVSLRRDSCSGFSVASASKLRPQARFEGTRRMSRDRCGRQPTSSETRCLVQCSTSNWWFNRTTTSSRETGVHMSVTMTPESLVRPGTLHQNPLPATVVPVTKSPEKNLKARRSCARVFWARYFLLGLSSLP